MPDWIVSLAWLALPGVIVVAVIVRFVAVRRRGYRGMAAARRVLGGAASAAAVKSSIDGFPVARFEPVDPPMVDERDSGDSGRGR